MQDEEAHNNLEHAEGTLAVDPRSVTWLSESNALILEELLLGKRVELRIKSVDNYGFGNKKVFVVRDGDDLHYLGNLIKMSTSLKTLILYGKMPSNDSFRDGLAGNKSIQVLKIIGDLGEEGDRNLAGLFQNTHSLQKISLFSMSNISLESMKSFTSLLRQRQIPSLKTIYLERIGWDVNRCIEFGRALSMQPQLERLDIHESCFGDEEIVALVESMAMGTNLKVLHFAHGSENENITEVGLRALSSLFQSNKFLREISLIWMHITDAGMTALAPGLASLKSLKRLEMYGNNIGDEGLKALAAASPKLHHLEKLDISHNNIGDEGLIALSNLLRCVSLQELNLDDMRIDDVGAIALANALKENKSLKKVTFWNFWTRTNNLTDVGLSAFERLLCDPSSVNNTYCSNHTLEEIGYIVPNGIPGQNDLVSSINTLLDLNKKKDSKGCNVPICKILASHSDVDMTPLLQWGLKLLPFVVAWFERAQSSQRYWIQPRIAFEGRKLSAVYQFVGGFSHAVVNGYIRSIDKTRRVTSVINQDDEE